MNPISHPLLPLHCKIFDDSIDGFPPQFQEFSNKDFKCNLCFENFDSASSLKKHIKEELEFCKEIEGFLNIEDTIPDTAKETITLKLQLDNRRKTGETIGCPKCQKVMKSRKGLHQHIAKIHCNRKKKCLCEVCGKNYKNKYALIFHIRQVHEKSTRAICEYCKKILYNKYSLVDHIAKVHHCSEIREIS
ncbi:unnamed protein product [Blepharisma stoltei]|uniref:C2H2-type domain-containing protein n=1 Tax=Blepharisma stoltei TaxID=1481888 RepID=A0AAU9K0S2_9CILI|nr:unnamed protein product [Blepharisma stoltei]